MLLDLGRHAAFIWLSYAAALMLVVGLIAWIELDRRRQRRLLAELEARGVRRRSEKHGARPAADRRKA